jgi:hypothetical protein
MVSQRLRKVHLKLNPNKCYFGVQSDAPPNFFIDSNSNPKMKTMQEEGVGVCSFVRDNLGVKGACLNIGMGIRTSDKWVNYSY